VPDNYYREGIHYVTLANDKWTQVVWEIEPLARERVTAIEIGYWVNKMLALPSHTRTATYCRLQPQAVRIVTTAVRALPMDQLPASPASACIVPAYPATGRFRPLART